MYNDRATTNLLLRTTPLVMALGLASGAFAQGLEEIVVTAQKRSETSQHVPISISALGVGEIENRGIANMQDLIGELPGVNGFGAAGSKGTVSLNMRGVSAGSPANISIDPVVGIYQDGVYIGKMMGAGLDVAELERIEVLRGPQGTLYGRNSTAGTVNFVTRKPTGEFGFRAKASLGNYDERTLNANMDLPAIGGSDSGFGELAASVGYQKRKRDALYRNVGGGGDFDSIDREAYRLALRWSPSDSFVVDYSHDASKLDEANLLEKVTGFTPLDAAGNVSRINALRGTIAQAQLWAASPTSDPRVASRWIPSMQRTLAAYEAAERAGEGRTRHGAADHPPRMSNEGSGDALTLSWDAGQLGALGDVSFKSITASRKMKMYVYGDLDNIDSRLDANGIGAMQDLVHLTLAQLYGPSSGAAYPMVDRVWAAIDSIGAYHSKQDTRPKYEQFSQEVHMVGTTDQLEYVLGAYYFEDEARYDRRAIFAAPLSGAGRQYYKTTTEALAAFGQATWRPAALEQRLALTLGLRYTEEDKDIFYDYSSVTTPFATVPARSLKRDKKFHNLSGNLTVAYQFTDDLNAFVRYATGYRSGGFNGEVFDNPYAEEEIKQWELGFKSEWFDKQLRLNASIYTYTYQDLQVAQIKTENGTATTVLSNAGEAKRHGGEVELQLAPVEDLLLSLGYSYIGGDFEKFPRLCGTGTPARCIETSKRAKRSTSPSHQLSVSGDYVFARTSLGNLRGYVQVNWQDEWIESALWTAVVGGQPVIYDHIVMDGRTVVDARITLEAIPVTVGSLAVSGWGRNLGNDDYPVFGVNFGGMGLITESYGNPRTYGLELRYEY